MACDPNTLLEQAKCYQCYAASGLLPALEIVLLCKIRDGTPPASCSPQTIISEAQCIFACIPPGLMSAVKVSLLCQIAGL
jgi:hypothetical protein